MNIGTFIAIDLKSFYASVECVDRQLNPLEVNLVVADESRSDKTICLAVSPPLKSLGVTGRPRLFEVIQKVRELNQLRLNQAPHRRFKGKSYYAPALATDPTLELGYIVACPRMARYQEVSAQIYATYLKFVSAEHIHVYSIDEVFIDVAPYLKLYHLSARELAVQMIREVLRTTGITATAGIGTNLYLCKIAMDIMAKRTPPDADGVRIAELDEATYRQQLWNHRPITDFWRVGQGYASKLEQHGMKTMGDVARMSHVNEELLYRLFGVNAELLIDHAWGWEPCTMADIKAYRPENRSVSSGQVLSEPSTHERARLIVTEMADLLALDLVAKKLVTNQLVLHVGFDRANFSDPEKLKHYTGEIHLDHYGRSVPQSAHGTIRIESWTASTQLITQALQKLFDRIVDPELLVRRVTITASPVISEDELKKLDSLPKQGELFTDQGEGTQPSPAQQEEFEREKRLQLAVIEIKKKLGKNALLKGMNLLEGATTKERNEQIGGHRA